jgi:hypothetical protein
MFGERFAIEAFQCLRREGLVGVLAKVSGTANGQGHAEARASLVATGRGEVMSALLYGVHLVAAYMAMMVAMTYQVLN